MDEGIVRMQAQMYSLVAKMHSLIANIEGMKSDNIEREANGYALAWPGSCFFEAQSELQKISESLIKEI
jgi:hypothetical protein